MNEEPVHPVHAPGGRAFWIGAVVGGGVMLDGLRRIWIDRIDTRPWLGAHDLVRFVVGGAVVHDLLVAPIAVLVGVAVARVVPGAVRRQVQVGLYASAIVAVVSWPVLRGYGRRPSNPTLLPRDYASGLTTVLVGIWVAMVIWVVVAAAVRRRVSDRGAGTIP